MPFHRKHPIQLPDRYANLRGPVSFSLLEYAPISPVGEVEMQAGTIVFRPRKRGGGTGGGERLRSDEPLPKESPVITVQA